MAEKKDQGLTAAGVASEICDAWNRWDDVQKAYFVQEIIKSLGEEKAKPALLILVQKNETEYKRLRDIQFGGVDSVPAPGTRLV
jgi:hypothetical protein